MNIILKTKLIIFYFALDEPKFAVPIKKLRLKQIYVSAKKLKLS